MRIKGKRGDAGLSMQQLLFALAEILIGIFLMILLLNMVISGSRNAEATLIATDFTTTLRTISSYPYAVYFAHTTNLSQGAINIKQDTIRVDILKGTHTAPLKIVKGITIQEKNFFNPKNIPIISLNNKIVFTDQEIQEMICKKLYKYPTQKTFTIIYEEQNQEEKQKLNQLKEGINLLQSRDAQKPEHHIKITDKEEPNSQIIKITMNKENNNTIITYNLVIHEHETFACYMKHAFENEKHKEISNTQIIQKPETNTIEIQLPSNEHLNNYLTKKEYEEHRITTNVRTQTDLMQNYAIMIYYTLLEIVETK